MNFPPKIVENAIEEISKLPGIGKKTALRLVLHLLKQEQSSANELAEAIVHLREDVKYCSTCHIIAETTDCTCKTITRDLATVCVVQDTPDVMAIENTHQYKGLYHVLGGLISPIEGIGPEDLKIESLINRIKNSEPQIEEVILALNPTMEGDTTAFYMTKKLKELGVKVTTIARGIPMGGELEYADELTLGRSILTRTIYE
ncbi:recombination mediator RecR [Roseivirga pacifica]|uniref:recombination mediator RecR n=1 Tax=Roseivirga pacifica TaxID=1267423 RepID=UPI0020943D9B|nr:recombination mediator RecR [Roseivirga pacifica]MCO6359647.1 recombination protein RecR [Roseivirga pacifica]MCO6367017.1 recombination protein RecR [Roseivirga pacifica]MCO6370451.1 recombination protein RecR [Roseivirga pacifica]MCO6374674.1 recombination protein RecR [Roseivirga pacifica]MCO6379932.1 recombination protein RecR [Roseivirga pacifica]